MSFKMLSDSLVPLSSVDAPKTESRPPNTLTIGGDVLPDGGGFEATDKAKYKIEIAYMEKRKHKEPSACSVTVWESGKRFHGGGDQSMFWCINAKDPEQGCGGLIPDGMVKGGVALCPHCKRSVNQQLLPVTRVGIFSPYNLAKEIHKLYRHLGEADLYLKFHKTDHEARARLKADGGVKREAAIYTFKRILQDSINGGDLTKRFESFLTA